MITPRKALVEVLDALGALSNNNELCTRLGITPTDALRIVLAAEEPVLEAGGAKYDRPSAIQLRDNLIQLRDAALKEGQMEWSVAISHMIALWGEMIDYIWPEEKSK